MIFKTRLRLAVTLNVMKMDNSTSIFLKKINSARAYTQQCKLKLLKLIVNIPQIKKVLGAYYGLIDIFVMFCDEEAVCAFFTYTRFLIKITRTSRTALFM